MTERKTLAQIAAESIERTVAGSRADVCPYCGCTLYANRTTKMDTRTIRYIVCRNGQCGKRFVSRQANATIVREVGE